ncbi:hypothetical protein TraAM80_05980 [Trypanosoma rangeli]|uniref:Uncharacterized protein n=1 Tax=Trypanosoma rangeli TaxID=5698 RepID=A0A3R7MIG7_TRYRA|nr:uncharacterized protein TraAM80_05980 [Trypanosoma rangeli]RNF03112.1 hypothetical protein TraAM80_05980 [Trypanosoma rangeli]|eukprot:RNF03112.1 hypothetical protein TraAM80_05980 [Trypanosoma rangeli]
MSDEVSELGPPSQTDAELSTKTIMEQQRVISTLREMVAAMKTRISTLEAAASTERAQPANTVTGSHLSEVSFYQEEVERLSRLVALLIRERDAAMAKCATLEAAVKQRDARVAEVLACCKRLQKMEADWRTTRVRLNFTDSCYKDAELQCSQLKEEMDALSFERTRWRAFAVSIANRLDAVSRERTLMHMNLLEREERMRTSERVTASPSSKVNKTAAVNSEEAARLPPFDPTELTTAWGTRQTTLLPSLARGGAGEKAAMRSSPATRSIAVAMRRKKGRYLLPL